MQALETLPHAGIGATTPCRYWCHYTMQVLVTLHHAGMSREMNLAPMPGRCNGATGFFALPADTIFTDPTPDHKQKKAQAGYSACLERRSNLLCVGEMCCLNPIEITETTFPTKLI
jgi:hypothetical protein